MDHEAYDEAVGANVDAAIAKAGLSRREAARESGIAATTLDRKIKGHAPFNTRELHKLAQLTRRKVRSFLPSEAR